MILLETTRYDHSPAHTRTLLFPPTYFSYSVLQWCAPLASRVPHVLYLPL